MSEIDARAIISPATRLGRCVRVSAYAVVGNEVELGDGCVLHPHAVVNGPARLGRENVLHPFCSVGGDPQDLKYGGGRTQGVAGDLDNIPATDTVAQRAWRQGRVSDLWSRDPFFASAPITPYCQGGGNTLFDH